MTALAGGALPAAAAQPGTPGAPTIKSAVAGVQNATVSFRKPADDGGAFVFAYRVKCTSSDGVFTFTGNGHHSPIRVGHLSVRKVYTCRVAARNAIGLGPFSDESAPVVPQVDKHRAVPAPPTFARTSSGPLTVGKFYECYGQYRNQFGWSSASPLSNAAEVFPFPSGPEGPEITSVVPGSRSVTVAFLPALDERAAVYPYRATCVSSDGGTTQTRAGKRSPIVVTGLSLAKTYTCTATAHDKFGWGPPSSPSDPVVTPAAT